METAILRESRAMNIDLSGHTILIAEDEPLIAMEIADALQSARASVRTAATVHDALQLAEDPAISVAIIDMALGRETALALCSRLAQRGVPFVIYTCYPHIPAGYEPAAVLQKPAHPTAILRAVAALISKIL